MVGDILLGLIRASREGNWQLYLFAIRKMIPWCFAYDRLNYARYLPAYYAQMINLQTDHPQVYQHFSNGGLSVQLADDNPFGRIPVAKPHKSMSTNTPRQSAERQSTVRKME